jgi:hypothetical protein
MQICLVILITLGLMSFAFFKRVRHSNPDKRAMLEGKGHQAAWIKLLEDFHIAQCYFVGILMIAAIISDLTDATALVVLMIVPLTLNGTVPLALAYLFLVYYGKATKRITLMTLTTYTISTVAYWLLLSEALDSLEADMSYDIFLQLMFELSSIPECGGYSAMAACPQNLLEGREAVQMGSVRLRYFTPVIWAISMLLFASSLAYKLWKHIRARRDDHVDANEQLYGDENWIHRVRRSFVARGWLFWFGGLLGLAAAGLQISLLNLALVIDVLDRSDWTFGQIVAVGIWAQPLLEYLSNLLSKLTVNLYGQGKFQL